MPRGLRAASVSGVDVLPLLWTGALDLDESRRFRVVAADALDRARSAGVPLAFDLGEAGVIDRDGLSMLVALGRTARAMGVPVRIDRPPISLRGALEQAGAVGLFEWPEDG